MMIDACIVIEQLIEEMRKKRPHDPFPQVSIWNPKPDEWTASVISDGYARKTGNGATVDEALANLCQS